MNSRELFIHLNCIFLNVKNIAIDHLHFFFINHSWLTELNVNHFSAFFDKSTLSIVWKLNNVTMSHTISLFFAGKLLLKINFFPTYYVLHWWWWREVSGQSEGEFSSANFPLCTYIYTHVCVYGSMYMMEIQCVRSTKISVVWVSRGKIWLAMVYTGLTSRWK